MELVRIEEATDARASDINALLSELTSGYVPLTCEMLAAILRRQDVEVWAVEDEGRLVGMATLILLPKLSGFAAEADDIVVHSSQRGKGLGRLLMAKLIERAKARGVLRIDLTSRSERVAANALYQKMGFERRDTNVYRLKLR